MNPAIFAYHRPANLDEAISLLQEHGEGAKLLAGGHSLLPIMKLRLAEPERLIDIGRLSELRGVGQDGDALVIGALTTHSEVASSDLVRAAAPLLAATAERVGDRQVRNRGTIGGALAHADAAADYPAAILALEATMVARGPRGSREIAARDFFVDFLTTALEPTEVLTEIRVPGQTSGFGWNYQKLANQASGYAIVGVAALLDRDDEGRCRDVRIGITGVAAVAWRAEAAEAALRGQPLNPETIAAAATQADSGVEMLDDLHGSAAYRQRVCRGLTRRALAAALERVGG
ncbi:MAG: xanthine dehydrogenase family protein subunit M [Thermomicrobiales bacterium]